MSAGTLRLSPETEFRQTACVTGDMLETRAALRHPGIDGDLVYLDEVEIKPMLDMITPGISLGSLIEKWEEKRAWRWPGNSLCSFGAGAS